LRGKLQNLSFASQKSLLEGIRQKIYMTNLEINISGMITTFLLLLQKNRVFCGSKPQNTLFFCSLPAHGAGKEVKAELDTNDTFEG
jgi:hypothetical protein